MKVSVIITVYNLEHYIEETLQSVLAQTYENLEIIVVNDCSIDNSETIILKYRNQIRYVKPSQNSGVLLATCAGLEVATGDIVTFLDGDDIWHPSKIEEIINLYQENPEYVLVSHDYEYIDEHGKMIYPADSTQETLKNLSNENNFYEINVVMQKAIQIPEGKVWLGSAFSINLKKFQIESFLNWVKTLPEPTLVYQDWPLATFVMAMNNGKFGYVNKKLFKYRLHESNHSGGTKMTTNRAKNVAKKGLFTSLAILEILKKYSYNFNELDYNKISNHRNFMVHEYQFLLALYDRKIMKSYNLFNILKNNYWTKKQKQKNFIRFIVFSLFGSKFFELKYLFSKLRKN